MLRDPQTRLARALMPALIASVILLSQTACRPSIIDVPDSDPAGSSMSMTDAQIPTLAIDVDASTNQSQKFNLTNILEGDRFVILAGGSSDCSDGWTTYLDSFVTTAPTSVDGRWTPFNGDTQSYRLGVERNGTFYCSDPVTFAPHLLQATSLSTGSSAYGTCAIHASSGAVRCWGGSFGPTAVDFSAGLTGASHISIGGGHGCALIGDGVKCWGSNVSGQLGDETLVDSASPVGVSLLSSGVSAVTVGESHSCALLSVGTVKCWGDNTLGQLGVGSTGGNSAIPVDIGLSDVTDIQAGPFHTCAIIAPTGAVKCWGANDSGRLGDGTNTYRDAPTSVVGLTGIIALALGDGHTCAITSTHTVKCWGINDNGQVGIGSAGPDEWTPVDATGLSDIVALAAGRNHTCALSATGTVKCWGLNDSEQFADSAINNSTTPTSLVNLSGATQITAGNSRTCALLASGSIRCAGSDFGDNRPNLEEMLAPVIPKGLANAISQISTGGNDFSCAVTETGGVKCWGYGGPQLGNGDETGQSTLPGDVIGLSSGAQEITTGYAHACALTLSGTVKCWGDNTLGQLGIGSTGGNSAIPVDVSSLSNVTAVKAGLYHTCAIIAPTGEVKCWGANDSGRLGDGTTAYRDTPTSVTGLTDAIALALGDGHTCVITRSHTVKCWGVNGSGQLGNGSALEEWTPIVVDGLTDVVAITAGQDHTCTLSAAGAMKCWGRNHIGQLGDTTYDDRHTPVDVVGLSSGVTAMDAGFGHTCAVVSGVAKCWGDNSQGKLGDGTTNPSPSPVDVIDLSGGVTQIECAENHSCALIGTTVTCWGINNDMEMGLPGLGATSVWSGL